MDGNSAVRGEADIERLIDQIGIDRQVVQCRFE
jgi:hypothetical protein